MRWKRRHKEVGLGIGKRKDRHGPTRWEKAAKEKGRVHQGVGIVETRHTYKGIARKQKERVKETKKEVKEKDTKIGEEVKATRAKVKKKEVKEKDIPKEAVGTKEREEDN